jgi:small subunit ribosomal protein S1
MDALLGGEGYDLETPRRGEIRSGTIARVSGGDILVDIGAKSEGLIQARELEQLSEERRAELVVGQEISVYVVRTGGHDGEMLLSLARADEEHDWGEAERLLASQEPLYANVGGYNKGGLIVKLGNLRGFVPASQVSLSRRRRAEGESPDKRWGKMVGEPMVAKVVEVDRRRNRLILSERAAAKEARKLLKEQLIGELKPGDIRQGHVISLADFGAFVDIGGADGLVHLSEISWKRIAHPKDALKIGEEVSVKVLSIDPDRNRISLSMRELEPDPWQTVTSRLIEGQLVEGTITKLTKFGAFASIKGLEGYDIEGLIHISELSDRRIEHPKEAVTEGETLAMRVIKIDGERRRIGLSLKRVDSAEYAEVDWQAATREPAPLAEEEPVGEAPEDFDAELEQAEPLGMPDELEPAEPLGMPDELEQAEPLGMPDEPEEPPQPDPQAQD